MSDVSFMEYISSFDILLLQETWTMEDPLLPGYIPFTLNAIPSIKKGRPSGGLSSMVSVQCFSIYA